MASIIVMTGVQEGDYYALDRGENLLGRSQTVPIHISDMRISRKHMKICFDKGRQEYRAVDLNSTYGVFINGRRIEDQAVLVDGDCITIGQTDLLFTLKDITDRESALSHVKMSRLDFPTINPSVYAELASDAGTTRREKGPFRGFGRWAGSPKTTLAIVFTDMVGSTGLTHELGNESMDQIRRAHFARARRLIEKHQGYEIKTIGDEFMVAFRTAVSALDFALDFHDDTGDERVRVRAGVHIGPVTVDEDDAQGAAVSYAARVLGMAAEGGVWISSEAKSHIDQEKAQYHGDLSWQRHPDCPLKGFPGKHLLWSVERNP
ncbi:MAG: FHA domain-containing protein [Phycisphaerales bacterium]|nr:MAG: FHA domain-containing protein [Phycisphaerales bacterium]